MTMMEMIERGDIAMGFNQNKITHHFVTTPDGGKIIITSLNSTDRQTINQIKNHILDIQTEFSEGNFTKPFFIHAQEVPRAEIMSEKKDLIKYSIQETNNGSSLLLSTNNKELVDAIKQFMQFQTRQHYGH
jgi:DNA replication protein DnaD